MRVGVPRPNNSSRHMLMASFEPVGRVAGQDIAEACAGPGLTRGGRGARRTPGAGARQAARPEVAAKAPRVLSECRRWPQTLAEVDGPRCPRQGDIRAVEVQAPGAAGRRTEAPGTASAGPRRPGSAWPAAGQPRPGCAGGYQQAAVGQEAKASTSSLLPPSPRPTAEPSKCRAPDRAVPVHDVLVLYAGNTRQVHRYCHCRRTVNVAGPVVDEGVHVGPHRHTERAGVEHRA